MEITHKKMAGPIRKIQEAAAAKKKAKQSPKL